MRGQAAPPHPRISRVPPSPRGERPLKVFDLAPRDVSYVFLKSRFILVVLKILDEFERHGYHISIILPPIELMNIQLPKTMCFISDFHITHNAFGFPHKILHKLLSSILKCI